VRLPFSFRDGMIFRLAHWEWQVLAQPRQCLPLI